MDYPKTVPNVNLLAGKFTDGNPSGGTPASLVPAEWCNALTDELLNILAAAGIAPDETDSTQLGQAIQTGMLNMGTDTGAANAYAVAYTPAVKTLVNGMVLRFKALDANTGASTINVDGLGACAIKGLGGQPLQGGEILAGSIVKLIYIGAATFVLLSSSGGAFPVAPGTQNNHAVNLGQFLSSMSASGGYVKLPAPAGQSSPILQGGILNFSTTGTSNTFPIAFPNAAVALAIGPTGASGTSSIVSFNSITTTGFIAKSSASSGVYVYLAFGY